MTGRAAKTPTWALDNAAPTGAVRVQACPTCRHPVLRALVEGRDVRADPTPLDLVGELLAKLHAEWTFDLVRVWPGARVSRLAVRYTHHLPLRRWPVLGMHACPGPEPPAATPAEPPPPDRLF